MTVATASGGGGSSRPGHQGLSYFPVLDGLRAVAVTLVVAHHIRLWEYPGGRVGVDVFFVLSGFLITSILWSSPHGRVSTFYVKRVRRLVPAFLVASLVTMALSVVFDSFALAAVGFVSAVTLTSPLFAMLTLGHPFMHSWTLAIEWWFYLVWPWVLFDAKKNGWRSRSLAAGLFLFGLGSLVYAGLTDSADMAYIPRGGGLLLGSSLACLCASGFRIRRPDWAAVFGLVLIALGAASDIGWSYLVVDAGTVSFVAGVVSGARVPVLGSRAAVSVGRVSYEIYLLHYPVTFWWNAMGWSGWIGILGVMVAVTLAWPLARVSSHFRQRHV